jgi:hypothetical protein
VREEITRYETTQLVHSGRHLRGIQHLRAGHLRRWQGSLKAGPQDLRIILKITRADSREWKATMLSIDQSPDRGTGMVTASFSMDASPIKFAIGQVQGTYEGNLSADGASITGTWTQGRPLPLDFHRRPTKETTWLDPSPHRVQFIPVEKSVSFEVLD